MTSGVCPELEPPLPVRLAPLCRAAAACGAAWRGEARPCGAAAAAATGAGGDCVASRPLLTRRRFSGRGSLDGMMDVAARKGGGQPWSPNWPDMV